MRILLIAGPVLACLAVVAGLEWYLRYRDRLHGPHYVAQVRAFGAMASEITPLELPPVKPLKAVPVPQGIVVSPFQKGRKRA